MKPTAKNIDEYLLAHPPAVREVLERLRHTIKTTAPKAEEVISYGMPAFRFHGILVYFAAFTKHCSLFPGKAVVAAMKKDLKGYKTSAGTIQFTLEKPLPVSLVRKIVKARIKANLDKLKKK